MRVHVCAVRMTLHRADVLEAYLNGQDNIQKATVYERTGDVVLTYRGSRKDAAALLAAYRFDNEELEVLVTSHDSRKINQEYQEKMVGLVAGRVFRKVFLPAPIAAAYTVWRSIAFVWKGIRCLLHRKLEVEVLDALSITASLLRGDYNTAGSVMFLLTVSSLLEEWTRKKSLDDLARSMALNVDKVWVRTPQGEVLVPLTRVHAGDEVVVRSGNMIPLDGTVLEGEAMVNQAALTGESMPVRKASGATVYAGTVVEEGECVFTAKAEGGANRYDKIVSMIEKAGYLDHVIFISFALKNLISLRRRYPTQPAQYLIKEWDDKLLDTLEKYNLGIDIYYKSATPDNVRKVHALGQEYNVWTVNEAVDGDALVAMGVDYITTNILEGTNKAE